ncbi:restriction endonuclease subunit S [Vibrio splendidus]
MSELPKGWRATLLNEVVDKIVGGGTPSKSVPSYYEGDIPWMTVKDMNKSYLTDTIDHITQEAIDNSSTNVIPSGTPIIASRMSLGKIVRASFDSAINQDLKALFVNREVDDYYFEYWYRSQGLKIESLGTGTTVKGVRLEVINALEFPLAPLAEQKRIVETIDEVLAQVDTIKARLDGIPDLLKRFRQSVLASAVSGKLTEEWRGVTDSYKTVIVNDICDMAFDGPFGSKLKSNDYTQIGCRVVRLENIGHLHFLESKKTYVSESKFDSLPKNHLAEGDILFSSFVDEEIRVCLFPGLETGTINKADCFCLRVNSEIALNKYVCYLLASLPTYLKIKKAVHGATRPRINLRFLKNFELELPDLAEQKEIVRLVDQYFAFADTIEAQVKKAQVRVDNLTQSILAKAFRGELVAQDPNDEPADKLLERIAEARKEAETLAKAAKKARSTKSPAKKRAAKNA